MGKGNKQVKSGEQTVINSLPDYARPYFENLMERAEGESLQGYQPYQGQRIAQSGSIADIVNSRDMARNVANQGMPETQEAIGGIRDLSRQGQFTGQMAQDYMNPYMEQVVDRQKQGAIQDFNRMGAARNAQAVNAGAFGGSRFGVAQSELARNAQDLKSRRIFEDLSRNFQQAQQTAQQSFESQQGRQFNVGQQLAALGGQQAGLGQLQQGLYGQDVAQLQQAGALSQQQRQNVFDAQRATQQLASQEPFQRLSFASGILTGTPASQMAVQQQPSTSPLMQVAGLGIMGLGAYKGLNIGNPV